MTDSIMGISDDICDISQKSHIDEALKKLDAATTYEQILEVIYGLD